MDYEALIQQQIDDAKVELRLFVVVGVIGVATGIAAFLGLADKNMLDVITKGVAILAPNLVSGFSVTKLLGARNRINSLRYLLTQLPELGEFDEKTREELETMMLDLLRNRLEAKSA